MEKILLVGGGGHCRSVIDVIEAENKFQVAGIIDRPNLLGTKVLGYDIIGTDEDLVVMASKYRFALVTVGQIRSPDVRIKLFNDVKQAGFELPSVISPRAYVSRSAFLGEGSIVMHDALLNANVSVGENCIINTKALIEHDSAVGNHCHISTGAIVNGNVVIKDGCFIGSHAVTREALTIQERSFIKAGSIAK